MIDYSKLNSFSFDEMSKLYTEEEKLVLINIDKEDELIGKYNDLPDIIVGLNRKFGEKDLNVISIDTGESILATHGMFLSRCDSKVREEIIERLVDLQTNKKEVKDFKLISGLDLMDFCDFCDQNRLLEK